MNETGQTAGDTDIAVSSIAKVFLVVAVALYIVYFSHLSIDRWENMHCSLDYGHIDSACYNTSNGKFMYSNVDHVNYWSDHFAPILLVLAGYYIFSDGYWFTFIWQSLTIGLAGIPLFLIARHYLRNEWVALMIVIGYLVNGKLHYANLFDYHMISHEPLFLFGAFYAMITKRWRLYFLFGAALVVCKEDSFILFALLGLYAALIEREYRKGIYTLALCGVYAALVFKVAYPAFTGETEYGYAGQYGWPGGSLPEMVVNFLKDPAGVFWEPMTWSDGNRERWLSLLLQYGFLPIFSPVGILMLLPPTMELYLAKRSQLVGLTHHYPLLIIPMWTLATVFALANVRKILGRLENAPLVTSSLKTIAPVVTVVSGAVVVVYCIVILYYTLVGPFDFTISGVRISMGGAGKPLLILFAAFFLYTLSSTKPGIPASFGKTRTVSLLAAYMILVNLYMVKDYGSLPVYSSWAGFITDQHREHSDRARSVLEKIPYNASTLASQGPFTVLHHRPVTHLLRSLEWGIFKEMAFDYIVVDMKPNVEYLRPSQYAMTSEALKLKNYGTVFENDGVFVLKRGHDKKLDYERYIDYFATSNADRMPGVVGEKVLDKSSSYGKVRKAALGKTREGFLAYGPYLSLVRGLYVGVFRMKIGRMADGPVAVIEVTSDYGKKVIARRTLSGGDFEEAGVWREFTAPINITDEKSDAVELRVFYLGQTDLYVDWTRIDMPYEMFMKMTR